MLNTALSIFAVKNTAARCIWQISSAALGSEFDKAH